VERREGETISNRKVERMKSKRERTRLTRRAARRESHLELTSSAKRKSESFFSMGTELSRSFGEGDLMRRNERREERVASVRGLRM